MNEELVKRITLALASVNGDEHSSPRVLLGYEACAVAAIKEMRRYAHDSRALPVPNDIPLSSLSG